MNPLRTRQKLGDICGRDAGVRAGGERKYALQFGSVQSHMGAWTPHLLLTPHSQQQSSSLA